MAEPTPLPPARRRNIWLPGLLVLLLGGLGYLAYTRFANPYQPYGTPLLSPRAAYDFTLTDNKGKPFRLSSQRGKVVLIFFGFVNCPDVCPTTLLELKKVYQALTPEERRRVQVVFISVDPDRDTPEVLDKYVTFFDASFIGLTGAPQQIAEVAKSYGVFYQKSEIKSAKQYNVDHTASTYLIDPKGTLRLIYGNGKPAETQRMVEDVRWALKN
ncbi:MULTISPECIES: SCO family protein [unclassified Meiothermus]|uniref:SCO family protein n=1 Tax=unclassified Meiothermus TaxID=370471 RepID=UPI000D7C8A25|nr:MULTISPECIES: SCO family protein [unclassified Meiothermus]PZA06396.1 SCO family protein [Meiothermus sp. Pnk-1]RYM36985.1 SCO family protein [Meiothermus sp. PNK-Is4]